MMQHQRLYKSPPLGKTLPLLLVLLKPWALYAADDFAAWTRNQQDHAHTLQQQFKDYRSEHDQQFSNHLKSHWENFQVYQGLVRDTQPKPASAPIAPPKPRVQPLPPTSPHKVPAAKPAPVPVTPPVVITPIPAPPPTPAIPAPLLPAKPKPADNGIPKIDLDFFGNCLLLPYDDQWRSITTQNISPEGLAAFWDKISVTRYQPTLDTVAKARVDLRLDDWGHAILWRDFVQKLHPDTTERDLLLWFFLVKSGVDVRLGYSGKVVHLFVAVRQPVYATSFIQDGERTYYALLSPDHGAGLKRFSTYRANYPAPLQPLDLHTVALNFTRAQAVQRRVNFQHLGKPVQFDVRYDRHLVDYMAGFPQMDFDLYLNTQASPVARPPILQALQAQIRGMSEEEAVNYLLAFVQKAFAYKNDQDQFGREKYFFVEEALHYSHSDCEDRSALFSWLARELLGLKTVGLHYPGHMTTGVATKIVHKDWQTITWQGVRYVIADPTYINASIGMAMPSYASQKPLRVIP